MLRLACLVASVASGCGFVIPEGDPGISLYAWNRSSEEYVVRVGDNRSDECFALPPDAFGKFYGTTGHIEDGTRPLGLYALDGRQLTPLRASNQSSLFVIDDAAQVREVELRFSGFGTNRLIMDLPEFPELDGQELPDELPRTDDACQT